MRANDTPLRQLIERTPSPAAMIVYGDGRRTESPHALIAALRGQLLTPPMTSDAAAREWATSFLIEAGELIQGLLDIFDKKTDRELVTQDADCRTLALCAADLFLAISRASEHRRLQLESAIGGAVRALGALAERTLPPHVEVRIPEGYAYYAVYPILYAEAAQTLDTWQYPWVVIGIRSIGTSLAAVVAATARTDQLYFVRPGGPPFRRTLPFDRNLEQAIFAHERKGHFAVVDEGPGLSGSSMGAVADCLQMHGVGSSRIHFLPSHDGELGPQASERHRERWNHAHRAHCSFESYFDEHRLRHTFFDGLEGEIRDISAGRWRAERYVDPSSWPPVHPRLERRKYLLRSQKQAWMAKFVGLGRYGRAQVERAFALYAHGFVPQPLAYREGFLVSIWHEATSLHRTGAARNAWLAQTAAYLTFLENACRAASSGASLEELLKMACTNTSEALGADIAARLGARWHNRLPSIADFCIPIAIDGRMHEWEWLALGDGRILKADALEHHADHGLVGCQDLAWDLAGLRVEHDLSPYEYDRLVTALTQTSDYRRHAEKEAFLLCCYLAYELGYYTLAADAASRDASEKRRSLARRDFYADRLACLLKETL